MTQSNQIKRNDDFKLVIVLRIEGQNSRALMLRFVGVAATIIAVGVKVVCLFLGRAQ